MKLRYRPKALAGIESIHRYLCRRSPQGAENVLAAIHSAIEFIGKNPYAAEATDSMDVRVKLIVDYPYKIFHSAVSDKIEILHVRHSARRRWTRRS
jgi:plasmid stabilization system protein ParE